MKLQLPSTKRAMVDRANSAVILTLVVASVVVTFCLVASKGLWDQSRFQSKIINKKELALDQLIENIQATDKLVNSYKAFVQEQPNAIGGDSLGQGERDGDNARLVLDALPSKYDFPALVTSVEKILSEQGISIETIDGVDEILAQSQSDLNVAPQPIEIPFEFSVATSLEGSQLMFTKFQKSIRPLYIKDFTIESSGVQSVTVTVNGKSYYQPETRVQITKETIQ